MTHLTDYLQQLEICSHISHFNLHPSFFHRKIVDEIKMKIAKHADRLIRCMPDNGVMTVKEMQKVLAEEMEVPLSYWETCCIIEVIKDFAKF